MLKGRKTYIAAGIGFLLLVVNKYCFEVPTEVFGAAAVAVVAALRAGIGTAKETDNAAD